MQELTNEQQLEYLARSYYILAICTGELHYMASYKQLMEQLVPLRSSSTTLMERLIESQQSEVKQCA